MATIISVNNQKGGVGKTVTSINLGIGLARQGKKVLLADVDAQGSSTISLGYNPDKLQITLTNIIQNVIEDNNFNPRVGILHHKENIDLIPSNISLAAIELPLMNTIGGETILKRYFEMIKKDYDYIILDCLPSLNILVINALTTANKVLIPVPPHHLSITGMEQLLITIGKIKRRLNPNLEISGILPTMVNERTNSMKDIIKLLHDTYDGKLNIYKDFIPQSIRATESSIEGKSIYLYDKNGKVAKAYEKLTMEVLKENEQQ